VSWWQKRAGAERAVAPREATHLLDGGAVLLDVREPAEWSAGHAPGATHVPLAQLADHLPQLPRQQRVVVVCRSGYRSARATALLRRSGVDAVNLDGGMRAWAEVGLPVVASGGGPGSVV
jgi:rhodanese-related sulfurtransferase